MKKFIQIALVVILVCVLFQAMADGSLASAGNTGSTAVSGTPLTGQTNAADVHAATCLVSVKGVMCVRPSVGWNT